MISPRSPERAEYLYSIRPAGGIPCASSKPQWRRKYDKSAAGRSIRRAGAADPL
jgi:hypothetical protein